MRTSPFLHAVLALSSLLATRALAQEAPARDGLGDELSRGVLARFGTARLMHEGPVTVLSFSADGRLATGSQDATISLWDPRSGALLAHYKQPQGSVRSLGWSPGGDRLVSGSGRHITYVWDAESGSEAPLQEEAWGGVATYLAGGSILAAADYTDQVRWIEPESGELLDRLQGNEMEPAGLEASPSGELLLKVTYNRKKELRRQNTEEQPDSALEMYSVENGELLFRRGFFGGRLSRPAFSADSRRLMVPDPQGGIRVLSTSDGEELAHWPVEDLFVGVVVRVGSQFATYTREGELLFLDGESGAIVHRMDAGVPEASDMAASRDGSLLAVAFGIEARILATQDKRWLHDFTRHLTPTSALCFSPDGKTLVTGTMSGKLRSWDATSGEPLEVLPPHQSSILGLAFSPDGARLASAGHDGRVVLGGPGEGGETREVAIKPASVTGLDWSDNGRFLAAACADRTVSVWDIEKAEEWFSVAEVPGMLFSLALSPDGKRLVTAAKHLTLWDLDERQELRRWDTFKSPITCVAFAPDGLRVAVGMASRKIFIYECEGGTLLSEIDGHQGRVTALDFSDDGRLLASTSYGEKVVRLWDANTGRALHTLEGYDGEPLCVAFHPSGRKLAVGGLNPIPVILAIPER